MDKAFISELNIENVRHLHDISIPLSDSGIKHLILTGRNGSGKTSVLDALSRYVNSVAVSDTLKNARKFYLVYKKMFEDSCKNNPESTEALNNEKSMNAQKKQISEITGGLRINFSPSDDAIRVLFSKGMFVLAYYKATRVFNAEIPEHVEKVPAKESYQITEAPSRQFVKYLLDLKVTEALARNKGEIEKADAISKWFNDFENLLKQVFEDETLKLEFDEDTFSFHIIEKDRNPFDFNTLASGFAALLDIVVDLIMRMRNKRGLSFDFNIPGIVLIDEIETHLHLDLQKRVMSFLTTLFPNIQFIVSTHSPFILNSLENVVIYDLENKTLVNEEKGLTDIPYSGIVEGYFKADQLSAELRRKFERYKEIATKKSLTDAEIEETGGLEMYLNEIPDYLALNISTEYKALKEMLHNREDVDG